MVGGGFGPTYSVTTFTGGEPWPMYNSWHTSWAMVEWVGIIHGLVGIQTGMVTNTGPTTIRSVRDLDSIIMIGMPMLAIFITVLD